MVVVRVRVLEIRVGFIVVVAVVVVGRGSRSIVSVPGGRSVGGGGGIFGVLR